MPGAEKTTRGRRNTCEKTSHRYISIDAKKKKNRSIDRSIDPSPAASNAVTASLSHLPRCRTTHAAVLRALPGGGFTSHLGNTCRVSASACHSYCIEL